MPEIHDAFEAHLFGKSAPVLFLGAGMSKRYLGTPDWQGLLRSFAEQTPYPYEYYYSQASSDLPGTASAIAREFGRIWWAEDSMYRESRNKHLAEALDSESPLKIEICNSLRGMARSLPNQSLEGEELDLLRQAVVDGIITTNYDDLLTELFPDFRQYVGQDQLLFANPQGVGEIYAIHGNCDNPNSLVLTRNDYERFRERNVYLAAKLITIFLEHPIIFLGYSMDDANIRTILQSILKCVTTANVNRLTDQLLFVQWSPTGAATVETHTFMLEGTQLSVKRFTVDNFLGIFRVLSQLKRAFPAPILRRLKEQVFELVASNDPTGRLFVQDIDSKTEDVDIRVVFGVGAIDKLANEGYVGLDRWALIDDILFDKHPQWDGDLIVTHTLSRLTKGNANIPIFKYLRKTNRLKRDGRPKGSYNPPASVRAKMDLNLKGFPLNDHDQARAADKLSGWEATSLLELEQKTGFDIALKYGAYFMDQAGHAEELREFLTKHYDQVTGKHSSEYIKAVCRLDCLENAKKP